MKQISGRQALLTGATGGLGPYIAKTLAGQGVNLLLTGRRRELLEEIAEGLRTDSVNVEFIAADLANDDDRLALARKAAGTDILINNAGLEVVAAYQNQDPAEITASVLINVLAPLLLTRELLPGMLERKSGHIINIGSLAGRLGMPYGSTYSGTKAALSEWGLSLWVELQGTGVNITTICPGFVTDAGLFARKERLAPRSLGSCTPDQVANAVLRALSSNKPEIMVNSMPVRPLMAIKSISPNMAMSLGNRLGLVKFLRSLTER